MLGRRDLCKTLGGVAAAGVIARFARGAEPGAAATPAVKIRDVKVKDDVRVETDDGTSGQFPLVNKGARGQLEPISDKIKALLVGKDPFQGDLEGEMIWEAIHPGKAKLYAEGRDPLTGDDIANKPRGARHTKTGEFFLGVSAVDLALWDLRGKLKKTPVYRLIGKAARQQIPVYWRPGEPKSLDDARKRAREAYDQGYRTQKWYFVNGPKEGQKGLKENVELVRVVREELGADARLMFDNHKMRHLDDVDYAVTLAKALLPYKLYWLEEPVCPEHVEGYARIKGETGIAIAGGEHLYTRWPVKAFLEKKCLDFVQCDPTWCGGISEWLRICEMVQKHPGVKVVPHITSPWTVAPHCVASQAEEICPLCEYNSEGGKGVLEKRMKRSPENGPVSMTMPEAPGLT